MTAATSPRAFSTSGGTFPTGGPGADVFRFTAGSTGRDTIRDFDAAGDDRILLVGFSFGASDPGRLSRQAKLDALADATELDAGGATIKLGPVGGSGRIRLDGVSDLDFTGAEDFIFG